MKFFPSAEVMNEATGRLTAIQHPAEALNTGDDEY
jgi:hypothetical protein